MTESRPPAAGDPPAAPPFSIVDGYAHGPMIRWRNRDGMVLPAAMAGEPAAALAAWLNRAVSGPSASAEGGARLDGMADWGAVALLRDAHDALEAFSARATAPGADRVHDDGPVHTFMKDCRAARALRERIGEALGPHLQADEDRPDSDLITFVTDSAMTSTPTPRDLSGAPEPFVPLGLSFPDVDFMPVDRRWLDDAGRRAAWHPADWLAALTLRASSLGQSPPASLPSDEAGLAALARCGDRGQVSEGGNWADVRERALDGWVLCSDGRYYDPLLSAWVLEMWLAFNLDPATADAAVADAEATLDAAYHLRRLEPEREIVERAIAAVGRH